ncbi:MAG: hypothetical protein ACOYNI_12255 [Acidimicrobiia bacterium]
MAKRVAMSDWHVEFTFGVQLTNAELVEWAERLDEALAEFDGGSSNGPDGFGVNLWAHAPNARVAFELASDIVRRHVDYEVVGVAVLAEPAFVRRAKLPTHPELVSAVEAAEILAVSRQRVHQLYADNEQFPDALYHLKTGPLWVKGSIEHFAKAWARKPGRPKKSA